MTQSHKTTLPSSVDKKSREDFDILELSDANLLRQQAGGKVFNKEWLYSVLTGIIL
tara:strand:+ start:377 stop:544 length:168 start_codon:yes stop_codon:yes gene_type:complete